MTTALAFACGAVAGWFGRRAFVRWRVSRIPRSQLIGSIVSRAP